MFIFLSSAMPSKFPKSLQMLALTAAAVPIHQSPTDQATFAAWEGSQTHQEAHVATQNPKVKPWSHPRCENPSDSCPRQRRWTAKLSRWMWTCPCGRAFLEGSDGTPSDIPLRGDPDPSVKCPSCKSPMCRVNGSRNGNFFSCSKYPTCRGTRPVESAHDKGEIL